LKIVDISNPMPKYLQISAWLKELIQAGRYRSGDKLPSELELAKMCGVNRNTLRQAIAELAAAGLLRKEKGSGTFVTAPIASEVKHKLERISSFKDMLGESGITARTRLLKKSIEEAGDYVAKVLHLGSDRRVVVVRRVRAGNGTPYIYEESYLPADLFSGILEMDLTGSMYYHLSENFNVVLARCKQTISAVSLGRNIAGILNLPQRSAGLFIESVTFDDRSVPVELLYAYHRGDKFKLEIELGRFHPKSGAVNLKTE
jgi:GntR family transcriptional regulator